MLMKFHFKFIFRENLFLESITGSISSVVVYEYCRDIVKFPLKNNSVITK